MTSDETHVLMDWSEVDMQRILDMLPSAHTDAGNVDIVDYPSTLDLEFEGGWEFETMSGPSNGIDVY